MKWKIQGAVNFEYESEDLSKCIHNAFIHCNQVKNKFMDMQSEGKPSIIEDGGIFVVGWYYRDERFLTLQFREVCSIELI